MKAMRFSLAILIILVLAIFFILMGGCNENMNELSKAKLWLNRAIESTEYLYEELDKTGILDENPSVQGAMDDLSSELDFAKFWIEAYTEEY